MRKLKIKSQALVPHLSRNAIRITIQQIADIKPLLKP